MAVVKPGLSVEGWTGDADLSFDGLYRYELTRDWGLDGRGTVAFVMLNPSTATAYENDPSVRRCIGFARRWGYSRLVVLNLFAIRSTDPKALYRVVDPVGPRNDDAIEAATANARLVVCAWGRHSIHMNRGNQVLMLLRQRARPCYFLKMTRDGIPMHPLYLREDLLPKRLA